MRLGARLRAVDRRLCPNPCPRCEGYCVRDETSLRVFDRGVRTKHIDPLARWCDCHPACSPYAGLLRDATDIAEQMAAEGKAEPEIGEALMGFLTGAA